MGIIDDLAMGLGFKARTEDYDARTAGTIARNEGVDVGQSRHAQQYLGSRGYKEGYRPQVAQDDRPFMQRLLFSQQGAQSPTPYALGPMKMDQAMPALGPLGLLMRFMAGKGQEQQDPRVAEAIAKLRSQEEWLRDRSGGVKPQPDQGLLPKLEELKVEPDMMYLNAEQPLSSYLKRYDPYIDNVPPASPEAVSADYGVTTQDDALDALFKRIPEGANNPEYTPQKHIIMKSILNPRYASAGAENLKYLLPPKVITEQPAVDTTTQPEPAMNFAQYVEAYRKREAPLVKSGRLKRETPLDALRKSYNQFYGLN